MSWHDIYVFVGGANFNVNDELAILACYNVHATISFFEQSNFTTWSFPSQIQIYLLACHEQGIMANVYGIQFHNE